MENTTEIQTGAKIKKFRSISYDNWGYAFVAPFFIIYFIFSLIPLAETFVYSMFDKYLLPTRVWHEGGFVGVTNFINLFSDPNNSFLSYLSNTAIMWFIGFVPQIIVSLLLAVWFTNTELNLKGQRFFKTVIYLPNLIMAAAFAMLFFALFSPRGPVNNIITSCTDSMENILRMYGPDGVEFARFDQFGNLIREEAPYINFFSSVGWTRTLVAIMNFLMWYGNTTILLMAGVMGIDNSLFEAARIDGASPSQVFFKITMPLLLPIFVYVFITSLIGGVQMFDVPQILTNSRGGPDNNTMTLIMKLNKHLTSKNYGPSGAMSVVLFAITGILSAFVYRSTMSKYQNKR